MRIFYTLGFARFLPLFVLLLTTLCSTTAGSQTITETFDQLDAPTANYGNGSFVSSTGNDWNYSVTKRVDSGITGPSAELRKLSGQVILTVPNGVSSLTFDHLEVDDLTKSIIDVSFDGAAPTRYETTNEAGVVTIAITGLAFTNTTSITIANAGNQPILLDNVVYEEYNVNVPVTGIALDKQTTAIPVGQSELLTATVTPSNASDPSLTWQSSDPGVATVDASGLIVARGEGTAVVTAITIDGGLTASCTVSVPAAGPVFRETFNQLDLTVDGPVAAGDFTGENGQTWTYAGARKVQGRIDGYSIELDRNGRGELGTTLMAGVKSLSFLLRTIDFGGPTTARVTVTINGADYGPFTTQKSETVTDFTIDDVNQAGPVAIFFRGTGNLESILDNVSWTAFDGAVAVSGVSISPDAAAVEVGSTTQLTTSLLPADATNTDVTWSSLDASLASVDANGTVTALAPGAVDVVATTVDGSFQDTALITITAQPTANALEETFANLNAPLDNIGDGSFTGDNGETWNYLRARTEVNGINGQSIELRRLNGQLSTSIPVAFDAFAFAFTTRVGGGKTGSTVQVYVNDDLRGEFQSQATGEVVPVRINNVGANAGAVLRIESKGFDVVLLDDLQWGGFDPVDPVAVTGVSLDIQSFDLQLGATEQLTARVLPLDATDASLSWISTDPAVATVDDDGLITALTLGSTQITVTTTDGDFSDAVTVAVVPVPDINLRAETFADLNAPEGTLKDDTYIGDNGEEWSYERASTVVSGINGQSIELRKLSGSLTTSIPVAFDSLQFSLRTLDGGLDRSARVMVVIDNDTLGEYQSQTSGVVETILLTNLAAPASAQLTLNGTGFDGVVIDDIQWGNFPPRIDVTGIEIGRETIIITEGESSQVNATVLPIDATEQGITYVSDNSFVASVDATGVLTAEREGTTFIVATSEEGDFTDTVFVTVEELIVPDDLAIDEQGWSIFLPGEDSRIFYCSDSEGDDANDGLSEASPVKTLDRAFSLLRNGQPDHLYLKRGDTWLDQSFTGLQKKSGKNSFERMVVAYYGQGARPLIKLNNEPIVNNALDQMAIIGIEFYNYPANPDDPQFRDLGENNLKAGFRFTSRVMADVLIEDCKVSYFGYLITFFNKAYADTVGSGNAYTNIDIRRNILTNAYQLGATDAKIKSQGIFVSHVQDFLFEENFMDRNGWNPDLPTALANQYNHNVYMSVDNEAPIVVRGNVISRGAAHGIQLRSGGTAERNAFIGNAIGMNMGYSEFPTYNEGATLVRENVVTDGRPQLPGDFTNPQTGAIWGLWKQSINDLAVNDNIVANILNTEGGNIRPYNGMTANELGSDNIGWNWTRFDEPATDPGWLDPTRNAASYALTNGYANYDEWVVAASNRGIRNFPLQFSAYGYVNYIREGFNKDALDDLAFEQVAVTGIEINPREVTLAPRELLQLIPDVQPANATNKTVSYRSTDEGVASVNNFGEVTALMEGSTLIVVETNDGGFKDTVQLLVDDAVRIPPVQVSLNVSDTTVFTEKTFQLLATIVPGDATFQDVSWSSTDPSIATVTERGEVTTLEGGTVGIVVTTNDEGLRDTATLTVLVPVTDLAIDEEGWSVAAPSADSRLIYCSNSEGDDKNDGSSPEAPVKTLNAAFGLIRDGFPDQVYLKRGDSWTDQDFSGLRSLSGRSGTERIVITYYGTGARPLVKPNNVRVLNAEVNNLAIIGIEFYNYSVNPDDPGYSDPGLEGVAVGFRFVNQIMDNLLIEDCKFSFFSDHFSFFNASQGRGDVFDNIEFRRNIFVDSYQRGSTDEKVLAQGMFISHVKDFLLEENFFDHNGWNENFPDAQPNQFNHNVYMSTDNAGPMIVLNNVVSRAAAHGVQLRSGGTATGNAFIGNAIGMNLGFNSPPTYYDGPTLVEHNVITDGRPQIPNDFSFPQTGAIWGLWKQSIENLTVNSNIVANVEDERGGNVKPYASLTTNEFGSNNIAWNWTQNNEPETNPGWRDPARDKDSYALFLGYTDYESWVDAAANRELRDFPVEFSAERYVDYIKEGFKQDLTVGACTYATADFPGAGQIVAISAISVPNVNASNFYVRLLERLKLRIVNRIRNTEQGTFAIGVATGIRADGTAGAWEIHDNCSVYPIRRLGRDEFTTLLPDIRGIERERGWKYQPLSITDNGYYILGTATNDGGFNHTEGWSVAAGTQIDIAWKLGNPFYRWIFGVRGFVLCDDLDAKTLGGDYFIQGCGTDELALGTTQVISTYPMVSNTEAVVLDTETDVLQTSVFPNPTPLTVVTVSANQPLRTIRVVSISGQVLRQVHTQSHRTELDLTRLASGVYIIEMESAKAVSRTKLIVN